MQRVPVEITAVRGRELYLDRGRAAGLAPDDVAVFELPGQGRVEAVLRSVSTNHARAELRPGAPELLEGQTGWVSVPAARLTPPEETESEPSPATDVPEHPPWTHPPESWKEDTPLLAPAFGLAPEEREVQVAGRVFLQLDAISDRQRDTTTTFGRAGVRSDATNLFGHAGRLRIDAQTNLRRYTGPGPDESDSDLWLDRLSYAHGDVADSTLRWEVGRFLQKEFPELQVLDGVEVSSTTADGNRFGASIGAMPEPFAGMPTGDDVQAAVFYRHFAGADRELALGAAYQSTWHDGAADRNLFLAEVDYTPTPGTWLRSIAWIDFYTSGDAIKDSGFELTELQVQGGRRFGTRSSLSATFSHRRWPELDRDEFQRLDPVRIRESRVDRGWLSGWTEVRDGVRVRARLGAWNDQDDSGGDFELGAQLSDLLWERGRLDLAVYGSGGAFASIEPGVRVSASRTFQSGSLFVSYDAVDLKQEGFVGTQETLLQQVLRASYDWTISRDWSLSVYADRRFGDEQDAYGTGFLLQRRF